MEQGSKESTETKKAAAATGSSSSSAATTTTATGEMADATFKSLADVLKLLPTSTVIVYEVLNPILTNVGACSAGNRVATAALLVVCAFTCAFSAFTDSFVDKDGKVRYGLVTPRGLLPFGGADDGLLQVDFSKYRLRPSDFAHAVLSVTVFAAVALLADANTVACFYPALLDQQKQVLVALPIVTGAVVSVVFVVLPSKRHSIGYPPPKPAAAATPLLA